METKIKWLLIYEIVALVSYLIMSFLAGIQLTLFGVTTCMVLPYMFWLLTEAEFGF
jgi:hypothetical protein